MWCRQRRGDHGCVSQGCCRRAALPRPAAGRGATNNGEMTAGVLPAGGLPRPAAGRGAANNGEAAAVSRGGAVDGSLTHGWTRCRQRRGDHGVFPELLSTGSLASPTAGRGAVSGGEITSVSRRGAAGGQPRLTHSWTRCRQPRLTHSCASCEVLPATSLASPCCRPRRRQWRRDDGRAPDVVLPAVPPSPFPTAGPGPPGPPPSRSSAGRLG